MDTDPTMYIKKIPVTQPLLHKDKTGDPRKHLWNYCQIIRILDDLTSSSLSDIAMSTQQFARFSEDPKTLHELAVIKNNN